MVGFNNKEDDQQELSDKTAKLTINVEGRECNNGVAADAAVADSEACRTPTAKEHRIPEALTCPPAPRKRKSSFPAHENEPNITVDKKEIESIFPPDDDPPNKSPRQK
ncbi:hypothetical protein DITRI_Ditri11bG0128200 [Diplodiscus trichospermus]